MTTPTTDTPASIGVSAGALWPILQPHLACISFGNPERQTEAVVVYSGDEATVFFIPASLAPDAEPVTVGMQDLHGTETGGFIEGVYVAMGAGSFQYSAPGAAGPEAVAFSDGLHGPVLEHVILAIPLAMLPEDVQEIIHTLPFGDAEDGEEMTEQDLFNALVAHESDQPAPPLFPAGLGGSRIDTSLLLGPGVRGAGVVPELLPPGGRGAPLAAPPGRQPGPAGLDGAGRGRGSRRPPTVTSIATPRITLASLSVQLAAMAASAESRAEAMEQRLGVLEMARAPVPVAATPAPFSVPPAPAARPFLAVMGALPKAPSAVETPHVGLPPPGFRAVIPGIPGRLPPTRQPPPDAIAPVAAVGHGRSAGGVPPISAPAPSVGAHSFHSLPASVAAAGDSQGLATALAEQAKAMSAMATMMMKSEVDDSIGELALPPGLHGRGARGTAALHAWRRAFLEKPQAVSARVRANRNRVMTGLLAAPEATPTMRGYFAAEVPFGHARTAAYLTFGLADVADLMEAGRWHEAEALVLLLLAAAETAALQDWQWGLAWTLTFLSEPPWARIRAHPPGPADLRNVSRLVDPELLAAAVGHMKDMLTINEAQRKITPAAAKASETATPSGATPGATPGAPPGGPRRPRGRPKGGEAPAGGAASAAK